MSPRRPAASQAAPRLHGARLGTSLDALSALRAVTAAVARPFVAALVCDRDRHLELTITVDGAGFEDLGGIGELVLRAVEGRPASLVIGIARAAAHAAPSDDELERVDALVGACAQAEVDLIDVIALSGTRWWSARDDACL